MNYSSDNEASPSNETESIVITQNTNNMSGNVHARSDNTDTITGTSTQRPRTEISLELDPVNTGKHSHFVV